MNTIHSDNPEHGFQFPGTFELSAMGAAGIGLESELPKLLAGRPPSGQRRRKRDAERRTAQISPFTSLNRGAFRQRAFMAGRSRTKIVLSAGCVSGARRRA